MAVVEIEFLLVAVAGTKAWVAVVLIEASDSNTIHVVVDTIVIILHLMPDLVVAGDAIVAVAVFARVIL